MDDRALRAITGDWLRLLIHPAAALIGQAEEGRDISVITDRLKHAGLKDADIASHDDYGASNIVAFRVGARYWGRAPAGMPEAQVVERLRSDSIRFYLIWNTAPRPTDPAFTLVYDVRAGDRRLAVYSVS